MTERELLALVWATKYFRCYLYGRRFLAITDHAALKWLLNLKDPSSRLTRWALRLSEFDYDVLHKPGKKHLNADDLSRHVNVVAVALASKVDLLKEQEDEFCLQQKQLSTSNYVVSEEGLLYNTELEQPRIAIPKTLISHVISQHHDTIFSGHQGIKRTIGIIRGRYF